MPLDSSPRCAGCGSDLISPPQAASARRRGDFEYVSEWRFCTCGAALCSQRIERVASTATASA